jgi:hypothetical protein
MLMYSRVKLRLAKRAIRQVPHLGRRGERSKDAVFKGVTSSKTSLSKTVSIAPRPMATATSAHLRRPRPQLVRRQHGCFHDDDNNAASHDGDRDHSSSDDNTTTTTTATAAATTARLTTTRLLPQRQQFFIRYRPSLLAVQLTAYGEQAVRHHLLFVASFLRHWLVQRTHDMNEYLLVPSSPSD